MTCCVSVEGKSADKGLEGMGMRQGSWLEVTGIDTDSMPSCPVPDLPEGPTRFRGCNTLPLVIFYIFINIGIKIYMALSDLKARGILNVLSM